MKKNVADVCIPKKMDTLVDELEEATSDPHHSVSKSGKDIKTIIIELKRELKKLPICEEV